MIPVKYPRTFNLPWSCSNSSDDVWWSDCAPFVGREVVVTEKMDGEVTTLYNDRIHARSPDSGSHPSRDWVKAMWGGIRHEIPPGYRICGENVYACHSVFYDRLPSYFFVFGIYDENNTCVDWDETLGWCELLGLEVVPTIYRGSWDEAVCRESWDGEGMFPTFAVGTAYPYPRWPQDYVVTEAEGYVVRLAGSFKYEDFRNSVAKFVRKNHVAPGATHWMDGSLIPNRLEEDSWTNTD